MRTNLSSQISLNRVSPRYYRPGNAVERSVLTRLEKNPDQHLRNKRRRCGTDCQ